jgi:hypothetical protein
MADGYVAVNSELIPVRAARSAVSERMWAQAQTYGRWLARLPFVRMVALTGALAMHNPSGENDDLDYLIVTARGRVWLARGFAVLLVRLARLRGTVICPNYVLAEDALKQSRQDLYIAHEVTQVVPLYGRSVYETLRAANRWTDIYLPNARCVFRDEAESHAEPIWAGLKRILEGVLSGKIGDALEGWEYRRKLRRFARDMQTPHSAARLDNTQVKGHFHDHGHLVLQRYRELLRCYDLLDLDGDTDVLRMAGD